MFKGYFTKLSQQVTETLNNNVSIKRGSLSVVICLLVFGIENAVQKNLFTCPVTSYKAYSLLFLFGPANIMFGLGFLTSKFLISGFQGCWKANLSRSILARQMFKCLLVGISSFIIYLGIALMQKDYYVCLKLGPKPPSNKKSKIAAESQMIGWALFIILVCVCFFVTLIRISLFMEPQADPEFISVKTYEKLEARAAAKHFNEKVTLLAEEEGKKTVCDLFVKFDKMTVNSDAAEIIRLLRNQILEKYPRGTGDLSRPYRYVNSADFAEMEEVESSCNDTDILLPGRSTELQALPNGSVV